jgi:hypothetical protein
MESAAEVAEAWAYGTLYTFMIEQAYDRGPAE